jgi:hypothetical protein
MTLLGPRDGARCAGVMASGCPSAVTEAAVQANIVAAEPGSGVKSRIKGNVLILFLTTH